MRKENGEINSRLDVAEEKFSEFEDTEVENQNQSTQGNKKLREGVPGWLSRYSMQLLISES